MKTKHKYTIETDTVSELNRILRADDYDSLLFNLQQNFWRRWKHIEGSEDYKKGVSEVLDALHKYLDENY